MTETIPWFRPRLTGDEIHQLQSVLATNFLNDGEFTAQFEREIAAFCGRRFAVATPNGTLAIAASLLAAGAAPNDEVMVPAFSYIAAANAARLIGCRVIFCDVEPDTFCLSSATVRKAITPQTRFIIAVELNGQHPDYENFDLGIPRIVDSCGALGSPGCCQRGLVSCLSFSPNKIITTGQGGMVLTNNEEIYHQLKRFKQQGLRERGTGGDDYHLEWGINLKLTNVQAAIGLAQLKTLPSRIAKARQREEWYGILRHPFPRLWTDILVNDREKLCIDLTKAKIDFRKFWLPLHMQPAYRTFRPFPNAELIARHSLWLPSSFDISQEEVNRINEVLRHG